VVKKKVAKKKPAKKKSTRRPHKPRWLAHTKAGPSGAGFSV
jgi:hypothetical protein